MSSASRLPQRLRGKGGRADDRLSGSLGALMLFIRLKQRLKGLGVEKKFKNNLIEVARCMFMGRKVYVYGVRYCV